MTNDRSITRDSQGRLEFLDATRGLAALLVLVHHVLEREWHSYLAFSTEYLNLGRVGIVTFFMVSGYVIPMSLDHASSGEFAVRRFFRLFPPYWIALCIYLVVRTGGPSLGEHAGLSLVANITMTQGLFGWSDYLPPAWTLSIELLFYCQCILLKQRFGAALAARTWWIWLTAYMALCVASRVRDGDAPRTLPLMLFFAALGHAVYLHDAQTQASGQLKRTALWLGVPVVVAGAFVGKDETWRPFDYACSALVGLALFLALHRARGVTFAKPMLLLGGISYSLYLIHPVALELFARADDLAAPARAGLAIATATVLSIPLYLFVERRAIAIGRRQARRFELDRKKS